MRRPCLTFSTLGAGLEPCNDVRPAAVPPARSAADRRETPRPASVCSTQQSPVARKRDEASAPRRRGFALGAPQQMKPQGSFLRWLLANPPSVTFSGLRRQRIPAVNGRGRRGLRVPARHLPTERRVLARRPSPRAQPRRECLVAGRQHREPSPARSPSAVGVVAERARGPCSLAGHACVWTQVREPHGCSTTPPPL
jgi:hypothetical protein